MYFGHDYIEFVLIQAPANLVSVFSPMNAMLAPAENGFNSFEYGIVMIHK
jgi:hypothetical protein